MHCQVLMDPRDRGFQTILWYDRSGRESEFSLAPVTYGVSSAPFLVIQCLEQLTSEHHDHFPIAGQRHSAMFLCR